MNNRELTKSVLRDKIETYIHAAHYADTVTEMDSMQDMNVNIQMTPQYMNEAQIYLDRETNAQVVTSIGEIVTQTNGVLGKLVVGVKKIIRKTIKWYVESVCVAQTVFNKAVVNFDITMLNQMKNMSAQIEQQNQTSGNQSQRIESQRENIENHGRILETYGQRLDLQQQAQELQKQELEKQKQELEKQKQELEQKQQMLDSQRIVYESKMAFVDEKFQQIEAQKQMLEQQQKRSNDLIIKLEDEIQTIKKKVPDIFENENNSFWDKLTVAQSGEDSIVAYLFMVLGIDLKKEKYLDLGANHAKELSNTYMLYKNGMRGVLVEANPQLIDELKFFRSEDVILNKCIGKEDGESLNFYIMNGDGLSSTSIDSVNEAIAINPTLYIERTITVESITVNNILETYFDHAPLLLNIDIEGMESEILSTFDYERYAPFIIIVERIDYSKTISIKKREDNIDELMRENGYLEYAYTGINSIFVNKKMVEFYSKEGEKS